MRQALCAMRYIGVNKMAQIDKPFNIQEYIDIALRRKWYIIIPLIICTVGAYGIYKYLPKVYMAETLILVQPQKVPETFVRTTITESVTERLNTISEEILSRTVLEKIIHEFNLYPELRDKMAMEEIVEIVRGTIKVKVPKSKGILQNTFTISQEGRDPQTLMLVVNKLAFLFIEENLKVRALQAKGTSEFLLKELNLIENELEKYEQGVRNFKEQYMGELPSQVDANLRIREQLGLQVKTVNDNIISREDRLVKIQDQIEQLKEAFQETQRPKEKVSTGPEDVKEGKVPEHPLITQLKRFKGELAIVQFKYKENHPDVIDIKNKISALEPKVEEVLREMEKEKEAAMMARQEGVTEKDLLAPTADPKVSKLLAQYKEQQETIVFELKRLREEEKNLKELIATYYKRVEGAPKREQELIILTRDYERLRANYQSLQDKKIQAEMAENLEKKQQGEQFKILDPARIPEKPVKPDRNKILLIGCVIGLAAGLGLTWFRESLEQSFHTVSDLEDYLGITVLATIPNLKEEMKKERKAA